MTTEGSGVSASILLIDDNPDDAQIVELMLGASPECGQEDELLDVTSVSHTGSLREAREKLEEFDPDIVLLDLDLPDSKGIETVERFNAVGHRPPFVVFTGHDERELGTQAVERGAQDYLFKEDLTRQVLLRTIRYAIERNRIQADVREATHRLALANRLLRQDIHNDIEIIIGEGDQIQGKHPADDAALDRLLEAGYRILHKTNATAQLTDTITSRPSTSTNYDIVELLGEILDDTETEGEMLLSVKETDQSTESTVGSRPRVNGIPTLRSALEAILRNTLDRASTSKDAAVTVSITEQSIDVEFVNEGRALPSEHCQLLCDPGATGVDLSTAGVDLQLASIVFDELDCSVSVTDNSPSGSIICVTFERVA